LLGNKSCDGHINSARQQTTSCWGVNYDLHKLSAETNGTNNSVTWQKQNRDRNRNETAFHRALKTEHREKKVTGQQRLLLLGDLLSLMGWVSLPWGLSSLFLLLLIICSIFQGFLLAVHVSEMEYECHGRRLSLNRYVAVIVTE